MGINYEQLKELPDAEKIKVLKELGEKYTRDGKPYFPAIATALGGSVIAVANLYNRLVEGRHIGRPKSGGKQIVAELPKKENAKNKKQKLPPESVEGSNPELVQEPYEAFSIKDTLNKSVGEEPQPQDCNKYNLCINAVFDGKEASDRIIAIANSFYKTAKYQIELKIKEL